MPKFFRKGVCLLVATATIWAGTAQAEEVEVAILEGAFFPEVVNASEGDVLIFVNESDRNQIVVGANDNWQSDNIGIEGSYSVTVAADMSTSFTATSSTGEPMSGLLVIN